MLDTPCTGIRCAWCEQPANPTDMQVIDIHDEVNPELITDVAMVCTGCLESEHPCFYHVERTATHQCPKCKRWYCAECREMFLPIDPLFWAETAMMCPQCHYELYYR